VRDTIAVQCKNELMNVNGMDRVTISFKRSKVRSRLFWLILFESIGNMLSAQVLSDSLTATLSLQECIGFALKNQPQIQQTIMEESISKQSKKIAHSYWFPQIGANANYLQYGQLPVVFSADQYGQKSGVENGIYNSSSVNFTANQVLFNNDLLLDNRMSSYSYQKATQNTQNGKIALVVDVSKAYYDLMLTRQQVRLIDDDIERLQRSLKDTYNQYQNGLSDKIDYKRATIALNNAVAERKNAEENSKAKNEYLKQLMGYPSGQELKISYDSIGISEVLLIDTTQMLRYSDRIEYQILQTQLTLQRINVEYYKMAYLPTISVFANYNLLYGNDKFSELFNKSYPNSAFGLNLSIPLFQGNRRYQGFKRAQMQFDQMALDTSILQHEFSTEYVKAMASYKSDYHQLIITKENLEIAKEVYQLVKLQYEKGIKAYLELIVAETDLRAAEINQLNSLYRVLSDKIDVQRSLGLISTNY
jgi:outer membrane protein